MEKTKVGYELLARLGKSLDFDPMGMEDIDRLPEDLQPFILRVRAFNQELKEAGIPYRLTMNHDAS